MKDCKKGIDAAHYMTASIHYLKCSTRVVV